MKIYTRRGDTGETSLYGAGRVPKDHPRVEAYGTIDELNSAIGLVLAELPESMGDWRGTLAAVQADCFTIGALLASPATGDERPEHIPELPDSHVADFEAAIDELDRELEELRAFILPGGGVTAARLHLARGYCRRAERRVVALARDAEVEPVVLRYLNRLGDYLFTLARAANRRDGVPDIEWRPERSS